MKTTNLQVHIIVVINYCMQHKFPEVTLPITAALAVTVHTIKGKPASRSPSLDLKCTLTVLRWTQVSNKLLEHVVLCGP